MYLVVIFTPYRVGKVLHFSLESAHQKLGTVRRPFGIEGWVLRFGQQGVEPRVWIPHLEDESVELPAPWELISPEMGDVDRRYHLHSGEFLQLIEGMSGNSGYGIDRYGVYVDITFNGVAQRLRYLPAGCFLMGSPLTENGRYDNEGPRHEVSISRGFWLADTTCTQALWTAVVGDNPSQFRGDHPGIVNRPVEWVSWNDVNRRFLPAAADLLGGDFEVFLPTEAQWEYGCRAGASSAFSFGESPEQAKILIDYNETIPVCARPPNRWGLFQMHGNLWEWCSDALRTYGDNPAVDPDGGQVGGKRVVRGGSWNAAVRKSRSACRVHLPLDLKNGYIGFRFALRARASPARAEGQTEHSASPIERRVNK